MGKVSKEVIENGKKIVNFDNPADPIRDVLGSGSKSHPEEWNKIIKELEDSGVEIIYRENAMAYGPHPSKSGKTGQFFIDPDGSISALEHEFEHFKQAETLGFPNMQESFGDTTSRISNEVKSYEIEIQRAKELGLDNVVDQLEKNLKKEIETLSSPLDWFE